VERPPTRIVTT